MHCFTSRNKHIMHETSTAEGQVRACVCFRLSFHFNCAKAWNEFCRHIYLSRFSIKILKNDYSTIFLTVVMIYLNVPRQNIVDFSISQLCGMVPFHNLQPPLKCWYHLDTVDQLSFTSLSLFTVRSSLVLFFILQQNFTQMHHQ